jgi:hypothetical protein
MIRCKENATRENILLSWIPRAFLEKEFQLFLGLVRKKGEKNNMKKVSSRKTLPGAFGSTFKDARQKGLGDCWWSEQGSPSNYGLVSRFYVAYHRVMSQ